VTRSDGLYELGPVASGLYRLRVQAPPGYFTAGLPIGRQGPEVNVTDQDVEGVDIQLEKAGSISGRVVDSAGQPVENARVSLALQSFNPMDVQRIARLEAVAGDKRTDDQGRFQLDRVPEGQGYLLRAGAEDYAPGQFGPFDLGYGETKEGIEIVLAKGGTLFGRITDQSGNPVPEYTVFCLPGDNFFSTLTLMGNQQLRKTATSDTDGHYRVERVQEGKNVVMLYRRVDPRPGGMPKAQRTVDVTATTEANFTIDVVKLDGVISGHVKTNKGEPAPNVLVMAMCKNMAMLNQEGGTSQAVTDKEGAYTINDLLAETEYNVVVMDTQGAAGPDTLFGDSISQVVKTSAENVDFVLPGRGGISGRVVYKLTGRPVPAFRVIPSRVRTEEDPLGTITALIQGIFGGGQGKEFSSSDGSFTLRSLVAGTYDLKVSGEGFAPATHEGVVVLEDQTTQDVVIEVEGGGGIEGTVQDARTKQPVEGALVTVQPGGAGAMLVLLGMNMPPTRPTEATTGPDGKFSFTGLDEGHVSLRINSDGYAPKTVGPISVPAKGTQTVQVVLARGGRIEGHVYDAAGSPAAGAQLTIFALDGSTTLSVTSDSEGFYTKESVPEGHYIVGFSLMDILGSDKQGNLQGRGEVRNGQTTVIDIGGPGGTTVAGTVRRGGQPVPAVQVIFIKGPEASMFLPGGMLSRVDTGPDGSYRATGLPAGPVKLLLVRMGALFQGRSPEVLHRREIELPETGEIRVDVDLQLSTVAGLVRDADTNEPVGGAFLMLFPDVDPGKYVLTCRAEGYGQQAVELSVSPGPGPDTNFALPKQVGEVIGRVTDRATGLAIPSAVVYLIDQHGQMIMPAGSGPMGMMSDQSGRFRIDSVAPGAYVLMCGDPLGGSYAWSRMEGVLVLAGQPTELEIQLDRGAAVVLSLVDPQGQPVLGAQWRLYDSRGTSLAGQILQMGNVMRTSLPPGQYTAQAEVPGFQPTQFAFVIEQGQTTVEAPVVAQPM